MIESEKREKEGLEGRGGISLRYIEGLGPVIGQTKNSRVAFSVRAPG